MQVNCGEINHTQSDTHRY